MNRKQRIQSILSNNFNDVTIEVKDNSNDHSGHGSFDGSQESHFKVNLKFKIKKKINRIEIHRKINTLLGDEYLNGLHALEINIL
jgi:BolA protein